MNLITHEVVVMCHEPATEGGYYEARAQIIWFDEKGQRIPDTCTAWCQSYSKARAISYALTEAAVMIEKGLVSVG